MPLEREALVRVALALLDDVGLDGLTARRLAERLGVQNPALYWHFKNKQDLLDAMARRMRSPGSGRQARMKRMKRGQIGWHGCDIESYRHLIRSVGVSQTRR